MLPFRLPYNLFVRPYRYPILFAYFNRLVHQDFSHSQSSSGTSTRSYSTTAEPFKCVEYRSIQKGSKRCTVGAVGISCLLCTANCSGNCDGIQWNIFITFSHQGHRGFLNFLQLDVKSFSLLLEDKRSKTSSYADNQANTLLSAELDHPRFKKLIERRQLSEMQFWSEIVHVNQKWFQTKTARNWRIFTSIVKPKNFLEILERFWGQGLQNLAPSSFISRNFLSHFTQALNLTFFF